MTMESKGGIAIKLMAAAIALSVIAVFASSFLFVATADDGFEQILDEQVVYNLLEMPSGIHVDGDIVHIVSDGVPGAPKGIRQFSIANNAPISLVGIPLHPDNDYPAGLYSDGETMWVPDNAYGRRNDERTNWVYAYSHDTQMRDTSKEFGADNILGICGSGETIWLVTSKVLPPSPPTHLFNRTVYQMEAFDHATFNKDKLRDITLPEGDDACVVSGNTAWVGGEKEGNQWYHKMHAYNTSTKKRTVEKDFDEFPDFSEGGLGLYGSLSISGYSIQGCILYAISQHREQVYALRFPHCTDEGKEETMPTQRSLDTGWMLRSGYEDDYP